jgi:hypothetical protein
MYDTILCGTKLFPQLSLNCEPAAGLVDEDWLFPVLNIILRRDFGLKSFSAYGILILFLNEQVKCHIVVFFSEHQERGID